MCNLCNLCWYRCRCWCRRGYKRGDFCWRHAGRWDDWHCGCNRGLNPPGGWRVGQGEHGSTGARIRCHLNDRQPSGTGLAHRGLGDRAWGQNHRTGPWRKNIFMHQDRRRASRRRGCRRWAHGRCWHHATANQGGQSKGEHQAETATHLNSHKSNHCVKSAPLQRAPGLPAGTLNSEALRRLRGTGRTGMGSSLTCRP